MTRVPMDMFESEKGFFILNKCLEMLFIVIVDQLTIYEEYHKFINFSINYMSNYDMYFVRI